MPFIIRFIIVCALIGQRLQALDLELFPDHRPASQIAHNAIGLSPETSISYGYSFTRENDAIRFGAGGKVPLFAIDWMDGPTLTNGGYGVIYSHFDPFSTAFSFIHADYLIGGFTELALDEWLLELNLFHISSHLGDDYIKIENPVVEDVGMEAIKFYATRMFGRFLNMSVGYEGKLASRPERLIFYRQSVLIGIGIDFKRLNFPFRIYEEVELFSTRELPNIGARMSVPLNRGHTAGDEGRGIYHELFFSWYAGHSKQGYFYNEEESLLSVGLALRI